MSFVIRTSGEPVHLISAVRAVMAEVEPNLPIHNVMTMEQRLANTTTSRRLNTALLGSFAAVALILAAVGIHGGIADAGRQSRPQHSVGLALGGAEHHRAGRVVRRGEPPAPVRLAAAAA